jgi:hypothetical protein
MYKRFRPSYLSPAHRPAKTPGKYTVPSTAHSTRQSRQIPPTLLNRNHRAPSNCWHSPLVYCARAVDPTLLSISNEIASQQASPTANVMTAANRALSYAAGHSTNAIIYHASDMILFSHVNVSYLSRYHARSVAGAYFLLGNHNQSLKINGAVHVFLSIILCIVSVSSAGEVKYAPLFAGGRHAASLRTILADLAHHQPPTIIMCDNKCAIGITNGSIKQKRSIAIDMRFHWIRDRICQGQFIISYIKTEFNMADY